MTLFGNGVFAGVFKVYLSYTGGRMGPKSNDNVLVEDKEGHAEIQKEADVKSEVEIEVVLSQAKEFLESPEARRGRRDSFSETLHRVWPCQYPDFKVLAPRTSSVL